MTRVVCVCVYIVSVEGWGGGWWGWVWGLQKRTWSLGSLCSCSWHSVCVSVCVCLCVCVSVFCKSLPTAPEWFVLNINQVTAQAMGVSSQTSPKDCWKPTPASHTHIILHLVHNTTRRVFTSLPPKRPPGHTPLSGLWWCRGLYLDLELRGRPSLDWFGSFGVSGKWNVYWISFP